MPRLITPETDPEFCARMVRETACVNGDKPAPVLGDTGAATRFPSCTLSYCEQRSAEWFDLRAGKLTASAFGTWLTKTGKVADKARFTAICRCLSSLGHCFEQERRTTEAMQRGIDLEPMAVAAFEQWSGLKVEEVGFATWKHGNVGASPDGLVAGEPIGFEGKCPEGPKHYEYFLGGVLPDQYYWQVHGSIAVTGAEGWWFQSFHPGQPSFRIFVEPNDDTRRIEEGLQTFAAEFEVARQRAKDAWDEENAKG